MSCSVWLQFLEVEREEKEKLTEAGFLKIWSTEFSCYSVDKEEALRNFKFSHDHLLSVLCGTRAPKYLGILWSSDLATVAPRVGLSAFPPAALSPDEL